jgi:hypothetical protein
MLSKAGNEIRRAGRYGTAIPYGKSVGKVGLKWASLWFEAIFYPGTDVAQISLRRERRSGSLRSGSAR